MAGMGEALGLMFAGAAGNYAENRSNQIGDEVKARLADAREQRLMAIRNKYDVDMQNNRQQFEAGQSEKERDWRSSESQKQREFDASENAANRSASITAASIRAANSEANDPSKRLQGTVQQEKDEKGDPTGRYIRTFRDGTMEIVTADEIPGGDKPTRQDKTDRETEANTYADERIKEMAGYLSSDKEDFKQFGGSRTKAKEYFKQEYLKGKVPAANPSGDPTDDDPTVPNRPAKLQQGADMAEAELKASAGKRNDVPQLTPKQRALVDRVKERNPDATDAQIIEALKRNPQSASLFQ